MEQLNEMLLKNEYVKSIAGVFEQAFESLEEDCKKDIGDELFHYLSEYSKADDYVNERNCFENINKLFLKHIFKIDCIDFNALKIIEAAIEGRMRAPIFMMIATLRKPKDLSKEVVKELFRIDDFGIRVAISNEDFESLDKLLLEYYKEKYLDEILCLFPESVI